MDLIFIRIINRLSIVFSLIGLLMANVNMSVFDSFILFLWTSSIAMLTYYLKNKNDKYKIIPILIMYLPMINAKSFIDGAYVFSIITATVITIVKMDGEITYYEYLDEFSKGKRVFIGLFIVSLLMMSIEVFNKKVALFAIIYFITSVLLLRVLRYKEHTKDYRGFNRKNIIYAALVSLVSFILSFDRVREAIFKLISTITKCAAEVFWLAFGWFFKFIIYILLKPFEYLKNIVEEDAKKKQLINNLLKNNKEQIHKKTVMENNPEFLQLIYKTIIFLVTLLIILFVLNRIFNNRKAKKIKNTDYEETREFIVDEKNKERISLTKLLKKLKPGTYREQIRLIYKKYILKTKKLGIIIEKNDTTLDINAKAEGLYEKKLIEYLRETYIKVRYSSYKPDKETRDNFISVFKKLSKVREK
ncbi:hypothetical protein Q428_04870 [Fervidicella metallireducens AeB]|uniref:DUF4129 domain-containing protein n=1 Tax=Fervidicella metallireducens AeB TaxID=1403537 RepID=A0A017RWI4_9CLOT|nr:hypothetical protein [Fervidicella metallireducens]EYE89022.1 hypothetical protein Q428_04870 [Fervidicella metallireducens AeB]